jgi:hypothetical protein
MSDSSDDTIDPKKMTPEERRRFLLAPIQLPRTHGGKSYAGVAGKPMISTAGRRGTGIWDESYLLNLDPFEIEALNE